MDKPTEPIHGPPPPLLVGPRAIAPARDPLPPHETSLDPALPCADLVSFSLNPPVLEVLRLPVLAAAPRRAITRSDSRHATPPNPRR